MNKIAEILGTEDAEMKIFKLIDSLVPKNLMRSAPKNAYEKGWAHALSVVELRIAELREG